MNIGMGGNLLLVSMGMNGILPLDKYKNILKPNGQEARNAEAEPSA